MDNNELKKEDVVEEVVGETVEEVVEDTVEEVVEETTTEEMEEKDLVEEAIESVMEESEEEEDAEDEKIEDSKGLKFFKKVLGGVIDQIISVALSLLLLIVVDFILKLVGLYIAQREPMFLIMYIIVNILYRPICELTKLKDTIGRKTVLK